MCPTRELLQQRIGLPLKHWLNSRYGSSKRAAEVLGISKSYLSMVVRGDRKANLELVQKLQSLGFDVSVFDNYLDIHDLPSDGLTFEQVKFVISELKDIIRDREWVVNTLQKQLDIQQSMNGDLRREITALRKRVAELQGSNSMPREFHKD